MSRARCKIFPLACAAILFLHAAGVSVFAHKTDARTKRANASLSKRDEEFLEDLERRAFQFFWEQTNPQTGLTLDRAEADGAEFQGAPSSRNVASIAATGFALSSYCVAAERGWIARQAALERTRATLDFFAHRAANERGWFYHWMDAATGERRWRSEISSIDTALLLAGILTAKQYFKNESDIARLADLIYRRVDFQWMLAGDPLLLSMGWRPETGFLKSRWHTFSEHLILQLLAIGSPTHPIPPAAWRAWTRTRITYDRYTFIVPSANPRSGNPLFVHQYPHAWIEFRGWRESWYPFTNYFKNSIEATRAQREFTRDRLAKEFPRSYGENLWGLTASDYAKGYTAWGAPPFDPQTDGTIVPCAPAGSLMFTPEISIAALRAMRERFGERIYKRYGFVDAFNPTTGWTDSQVIGIDVGITLLSAENLRTGDVWCWFMRNREIPNAMRAVGLR